MEDPDCGSSNEKRVQTGRAAKGRKHGFASARIGLLNPCRQLRRGPMPSHPSGYDFAVRPADIAEPAIGTLIRGLSACNFMEIRRSLDSPVSSYVSKDFVKVSTNDSVADAAEAMKEANAGEAIVLKGGKPIGIVTERDILYKVVASGKNPSTTEVSAVMSSPVESVGADSKVGDAIAKMSKLGIRRLLVMKNGKLEGIVTQKRMVSGQENVELPELVNPKGIACPYCGAVLKDAEELSKHMDQLHVGEGLLEGDRRKW